MSLAKEMVRYLVEGSGGRKRQKRIAKAILKKKAKENDFEPNKKLKTSLMRWSKKLQDGNKRSIKK